MKQDCGRAAAEVSRFYEEIAHLRPKLKVVLVQLPPALEYGVRISRTFFQAVPRLRGTVVVCEPRHESWFTAKADDGLRGLKVARVAADPARCAGAADSGGERRFSYYRWHGSPRMYYSKYTDGQLRDFAYLDWSDRAPGKPGAFLTTPRTTRPGKMQFGLQASLRVGRLLDPTGVCAGAYLGCAPATHYPSDPGATGALCDRIRILKCCWWMTRRCYKA